MRLSAMRDNCISVCNMENIDRASTPGNQCGGANADTNR